MFFSFCVFWHLRSDHTHVSDDNAEVLWDNSVLLCVCLGAVLVVVVVLCRVLYFYLSPLPPFFLRPVAAILTSVAQGGRHRHRFTEPLSAEGSS